MIPVNQPLLGECELAYVQEALGSGWISGAGPFVTRFEEEWSGYCGRRHGIAVCNGTAALEAAFHALQLPAGSEVILPAFTLIACARAALAQGLKIVLVDADPVTWCMDPAQVEAALTPQTRAILMVHIYGHPVDAGAICRLARDREIKIIEDAAEAHGATCRGRRCGSFGDISVFSFYANKLITTGEGGMVLCDDDAVAERCRSYRNLCFGSRERFRHEELAPNYRFSNLLAAIGCAQFSRLEQLLARKKDMAAFYNRELRGIPGLRLPAHQPWADPMYWVYGIVLEHGQSLDAREMARRLEQLGVETRPFFLGLHEQPALRSCFGDKPGAFPVTEFLSRRGLYLPSGLALEPPQMASVVSAIKQAMG